MISSGEKYCITTDIFGVITRFCSLIKLDDKIVNFACETGKCNTFFNHSLSPAVLPSHQRSYDLKSDFLWSIEWDTEVGRAARIFFFLSFHKPLICASTRVTRFIFLTNLDEMKIGYCSNVPPTEHCYYHEYIFLL